MKADIGKLQAARELIARPGGWCRGSLAQNELGRSVYPLSHEAVSFCLYGALIRVTNDAPYSVTGGFLALLDQVVGDDAVRFNNEQAEVAPVLAVFDRAIELARSQEAAV